VFSTPYGWLIDWQSHLTNQFKLLIQHSACKVLVLHASAHHSHHPPAPMQPITPHSSRYEAGHTARSTALSVANKFASFDFCSTYQLTTATDHASVELLIGVYVTM